MIRPGEVLIKSFEQLRLDAYQGAADRRGVITVGWGHVVKPGEPYRLGSRITIDEAQRLFDEDYDHHYQGVRQSLPRAILESLTQEQKGALVSLAFNIGVAGFRSSKVRELVSEGQIDEAAKYFKSWVRSAGWVQPGLLRRRAAEKALFLGDLALSEEFMEGSGDILIAKARRYIGL
jgi:lysozyme